MSGAAEHSLYMEEGCVASINVVLSRAAIRGKQWEKTHRNKLLGIFVTALKAASDVIGMLVSEVRDGRRGLCRSLAFRFSNFLTVGAIVTIVAVVAVVTVVMVVVVVVEGGSVAIVG